MHDAAQHSFGKKKKQTSSCKVILGKKLFSKSFNTVYKMGCSFSSVTDKEVLSSLTVATCFIYRRLINRETSRTSAYYFFVVLYCCVLLGGLFVAKTKIIGLKIIIICKPCANISSVCAVLSASLLVCLLFAANPVRSLKD